MSEPRAYDVRSIANYVLDERSRFSLETSHLSLQKLVYFAHGLFLVRFGRPLVDGYFEAWDHGPVHPFLYQIFKSSGSEPIVDRCVEEDLLTGSKRTVAYPEDAETRQLVSEVVLQLRSFTASQLRAKSHAGGSPWHSVRETAKTELASKVRIPDSVILERYFRHMSTVEDVLRGAVDDQNHEVEPYRSRK